MTREGKKILLKWEAEIGKRTRPTTGTTPSPRKKAHHTRPVKAQKWRPVRNPRNERNDDDNTHLLGPPIFSPIPEI